MNKKLMKTLRSCTAFEGGNLLVARLLAIPADAGLTLALCRRARILFWAGIGALCLFAWSPGKGQPAGEQIVEYQRRY